MDIQRGPKAKKNSISAHCLNKLKRPFCTSLVLVTQLRSRVVSVTGATGRNNMWTASECWPSARLIVVTIDNTDSHDH